MNFLFDPKLNHFLQSFRSPLLTFIMLAVSLFGSKPFLMLAAGSIFFRVGWKRSFVLIQMLFWSFILTNFLKELLYLPRPIQIDPSLLTFGEYLPSWLVESLADNPGFPSGHVCSTVVFWGTVLISFPGQFQKIAGVALIFLMPISRMYLGRHFLGDVLGGLLLGLLIILVGHVRLVRSQKDPLFLKSLQVKLAFYLVLPLILNLISFFPSNDLGQLFGFNIAIFCSRLKTFKSSNSGFLQFIIAIVIFVSIYVALSFYNFVPNRWIHFLICSIPMFCAIIVAEISGRFFNRVGNVVN